MFHAGGGGPVAFLGGFGEQLHDDFRDGIGDFRKPAGRRRRPPRNVAVHPLHRIGRCEGEGAGEHLVEGYAEGIEVAAGVDRPVHASGLFGRHVGEGAGNGLGRCGGLPFAGQAQGDAEPSEPDFLGRAVHQDIGRLDVLVGKAAPMHLAESRRDIDGEAQAAPHLQRCAKDAPSCRSSGSPPGYSSKSMVRPWWRPSSSGSAAQDPSSASFKPYSCVRRSTMAGIGCSPAGETASTVSR